jgi:hypothetical protein
VYDPKIFRHLIGYRPVINEVQKIKLQPLLPQRKGSVIKNVVYMGRGSAPDTVFENQLWFQKGSLPHIPEVFGRGQSNPTVHKLAGTVVTYFLSLAYMVGAT